MGTLTHPVAAVVGMQTNGLRVNQVTIRCPYCSGRHTHEWFGEPDGLREPTCGAIGSYAITVDTRARIDHMRTEYPAPDGVVGLVPLHISYAYERDGATDVVGVVLQTTLGAFAVWLEADSAVQLAGQLVTIVEHRDMLRERYIERETGPSDAVTATNAAEVG